MNASTTCVCLALSCVSAHATITLNIDAADLRTFDGTQLMPLSGQVLLVASTTNGVFGGPTISSFVTGDDVILFRGDLAESGQPGIFQRPVNIDLSLFPGLSPGDPVQLYWFPTLTASSTSPGEGTTYGFYRHDTGLDGSAPWVVPGDGSLVDLKFITASQGGSNSNVLGYANQTVQTVGRPVILSLTFANTTNAVITWSAVSNVTYRVRYCSEIASPWTNLVPDVVATNNTASIVDHPNGAPRRFYQVLIPTP